MSNLAVGINDANTNITVPSEPLQTKGDAGSHPVVDAPKKRGRPLGSKNKPKVAAPKNRGLKKKHNLLPKAKTPGKRGRPAFPPETFVSRQLEDMLLLSEKRVFALLRDDLMLPKINARQTKISATPENDASALAQQGDSVIPEAVFMLRITREAITKVFYERKDANPARVSCAPALPSKIYRTDPLPSLNKTPEVVAAEAFTSTLKGTMPSKKVLSRLFFEWMCSTAGTDDQIASYALLKKIGSVLNDQKGYRVALPTELEFNGAMERKAKRGMGSTPKARQQVYHW